MNKIMKLTILYICAFGAINCYAFNETITHPDLTEKVFSTKASGLNIYFIDQLGFQTGTDTLFNHNKIDYWLRTGSTKEDIPTCRAANHFHNPLKDWDKSQSTDVWPQDAICQLLG